MKKVRVDMMTSYSKDSMNLFLSLMQNRFACKKFDTNRKLTSQDINYILECARLSPSSFGLEHWHFYAVVTPQCIRDLYDVCFQQEAVLTSSLIVISVYRKNEIYSPDSLFISQRGSRFPGGLDTFVADYQGYYNFLRETDNLNHWAKAQCYIPCANMMTGAIAADIDSCAIEGFDNAGVLSVLNLDPSLWDTGIITVFGYSVAEESREKIRMSTEDIITYV